MRNPPLFIRLCEAFVDNLALVLRAALVFGAIGFVHELDNVRERFSPADEDAPAVTTTTGEQPAPSIPAADESESWLTEGVRHALNCTRTEYRNRHYDECVQEPSDVYQRPDTDDDTGFLAREDLVLYARLTPGDVTTD